MNTDTVPLPPVAQTSAELRQRILDTYDAMKPSLAAMQEYSTRMGALSEEYHLAKLREAFPSAPLKELSLVTTRDIRSTPASLDKALEALKELEVKQIIHDRIAGVFHLLA